jgi:hypothetical protein
MEATFLYLCGCLGKLCIFGPLATFILAMEAQQLQGSMLLMKCPILPVAGKYLLCHLTAAASA